MKTKQILSKIHSVAKTKDADNDPFIMRIKAYATTEKKDRYGEITDKAAFMRAMPKFMTTNGAVSMYNHRTNIGKILSYEEDKKGVIVETGIANTTQGRDLAELISVGAVSRMSFMFGNSEYEKVDESTRRLKAFEIFEIGPVDIPANTGARIIGAKDFDPEKEIETINLDESKRRNEMPLELTEKQMKDHVAEIVGPMKSEVDTLKSDYVTMEENITKGEKLLNEVDEKQKQLLDGRITKDEFDSRISKMAEDMVTIQKDLKRQNQARRIDGNRVEYTNWKHLNSDIKVVFDENGKALPEHFQKAYHFLHSPFDFSDGSQEARRLKDLRDLNDIIVISDAYFRKMGRGNYKIENLKTFRIFKELLKQYDPDLEKAMYSTGTGVGDEWVPTEFSAQLHEAYELEFELEAHIPRWEMPSNAAYFPVRGARPRGYRVGEAAVNNAAQMTKGNQTTANTLFTTETFGVAVQVAPEFIEDSIIAVAPLLRQQLAIAMRETNESRVINADDTTAGTHMDTAADWATDTTYPESYEKGFRKFAIAGTQTLNVQSTSAGVGDAAATFGAGDLRGLRKLLPNNSGHRAKELVYVVSLDVWLKMLSFAQYSQPGTYGANASWLTGDLPAFDGSPVVVSSELSTNFETTGLETGSSGLNGALCFNKNDFKIGYRRGVTLEFDKDILSQQWSFVATMRNSFKSMSVSLSEQVAYAINIPV